MAELTYVTADDNFSDIDIYACSIAYAELLRLLGQDAKAVVNTKFTESLTDELKNLKVDYMDSATVDWKLPTKVIIVDRSDPELTKIIPAEKITELFDHHFGFEEYWKERLGEKSHIEKVGSCATLIWEEAVKKDLSGRLSCENVTLLYTAIISNTLNLKAGVTTSRDIKAARETLQIAGPDSDFTKRYFETVSGTITKDPYQAVLKDVKTIELGQGKLAIGQLEVWDSGNIEKILEDKCSLFLPGYEDIPWFITIASISDGMTALIAKEGQVRELLGPALNIEWDGKNSAHIGKLLLRKELIKKLKDSSH